MRLVGKGSDLLTGHGARLMARGLGGGGTELVTCSAPPNRRWCRSRPRETLHAPFTQIPSGLFTRTRAGGVTHPERGGAAAKSPKPPHPPGRRVGRHLGTPTAPPPTHGRRSG